jgi:hypothetical protein
MTDTVTRYVPTFVGKDGLRTLMQPAQGRNTYATAFEAQTWIEEVLKNTSQDTIRQLYGESPDFEVRACQCHAGHFDPVGVYFD